MGIENEQCLTGLAYVDVNGNSFALIFYNHVTMSLNDINLSLLTILLHDITGTGFSVHTYLSLLF